MGYYSYGSITLMFKHPIRESFYEQVSLFDDRSNNMLVSKLIDIFEERNLYFDQVYISGPKEVYISFNDLKWYEGDEGKDLENFGKEFNVDKIDFWRSGEDEDDIENWTKVLNKRGEYEIDEEIVRTDVTVGSLGAKLLELVENKSLTDDDKVALELILSKYN